MLSPSRRRWLSSPPGRPCAWSRLIQSGGDAAGGRGGAGGGTRAVRRRRASSSPEATQLEGEEEEEGSSAGTRLVDGRQPGSEEEEEEEEDGEEEAEKEEVEEDHKIRGSCFNCGAGQENCASPTSNTCGTRQDVEDESEEEEDEDEENEEATGEGCGWSIQAVWGDPGGREVLGVTSAQELRYKFWWNIREEERVQWVEEVD